MSGSNENRDGDEAGRLLREIEEAFGGVPRGTLSIYEASLLDHFSRTEAQMSEAKGKETTSSWQQIPDQAIVDNGYALPFMDAAAWRYYVPAYMRWSIRHLTEKYADPVDATIYTFATDERSDERRSLLTPAQSRAVKHFLEYMVRHPNEADADVAREALDAYWGRL